MKFTYIILLALISFVFSSSAYAMNISGCSNMLNNGWYKKYKYRGVDGAAFKATTKDGFKGSSATSTEGSTASLDPKYSANYSTFGSQYWSSWGPCAMFGSNEIRENREKYFVQNRDEILKDIAVGQGEHVNVLASFSLCEDKAISTYGAELQKNIGSLIQPKNSYNQALDQIVSSNSFLAANCFFAVQ